MKAEKIPPVPPVPDVVITMTLIEARMLKTVAYGATHVVNALGHAGFIPATQKEGDVRRTLQNLHDALVDL